MDHGVGQREKLGDRLGRSANPEKSARGSGVASGWPHHILSEGRMDQSSLLGPGMEVRKMFSEHHRNGRKRQKRHSLYGHHERKDQLAIRVLR